MSASFRTFSDLTSVALNVVVAGIYQKPIEEYFAHYKVPATLKLINGGELNKNMDVSTFCDSPTVLPRVTLLIPVSFDPPFIDLCRDRRLP